jgi:hypothetical protein
MAQESMLVPDEIWREIPTHRLPRGRVFALVALVAALAGLVGAGVATGVFSPRLTTNIAGSEYKEGSKEFMSQFDVTNEGLFAVTLDRPKLSAPWLKLTSAHVGSQGQEPLNAQSGATGLPVTIGPGETVQFQLDITVSDCEAINRSGSDVVFDAKGPLLTRDVNVQPPGDQYPNAPSSYSYTGDDPWMARWPVLKAAAACGVPAPAH